MDELALELGLLCQQLIRQQPIQQQQQQQQRRNNNDGRRSQQASYFYPQVCSSVHENRRLLRRLEYCLSFLQNLIQQQQQHATNFAAPTTSPRLDGHDPAERRPAKQARSSSLVNPAARTFEEQPQRPLPRESSAGSAASKRDNNDHGGDDGSTAWQPPENHNESPPAHTNRGTTATTRLSPSFSWLGWAPAETAAWSCPPSVKQHLWILLSRLVLPAVHDGRDLFARVLHQAAQCWIRVVDEQDYLLQAFLFADELREAQFGSSAQILLRRVLENYRHRGISTAAGAPSTRTPTSTAALRATLEEWNDLKWLIIVLHHHFATGGPLTPHAVSPALLIQALQLMLPVCQASLLISQPVLSDHHHHASQQPQPHAQTFSGHRSHQNASLSQTHDSKAAPRAHHSSMNKSDINSTTCLTQNLRVIVGFLIDALVQAYNAAQQDHQEPSTEANTQPEEYTLLPLAHWLEDQMQDDINDESAQEHHHQDDAMTLSRFQGYSQSLSQPTLHQNRHSHRVRRRGPFHPAAGGQYQHSSQPCYDFEYSRHDSWRKHPHLSSFMDFSSSSSHHRSTHPSPTVVQLVTDLTQYAQLLVETAQDRLDETVRLQKQYQTSMATARTMPQSPIKNGGNGDFQDEDGDECMDEDSENLEETSCSSSAAWRQQTLIPAIQDCWQTVAQALTTLENLAQWDLESPTWDAPQLATNLWRTLAGSLLSLSRPERNDNNKRHPATNNTPQTDPMTNEFVVHQTVRLLLQSLHVVRLLRQPPLAVRTNNRDQGLSQPAAEEPYGHSDPNESDFHHHSPPALDEAANVSSTSSNLSAAERRYWSLEWQSLTLTLYRLIAVPHLYRTDAGAKSLMDILQALIVEDGNRQVQYLVQIAALHLASSCSVPTSTDNFSSLLHRRSYEDYQFPYHDDTDEGSHRHSKASESTVRRRQQQRHGAQRVLLDRLTALSVYVVKVPKVGATKKKNSKQQVEVDATDDGDPFQALYSAEWDRVWQSAGLSAEYF